MEQYRDQIESGNRTLRGYAEQIEDKTLRNMQESTIALQMTTVIANVHYGFLLLHQF